MYTVEILGRAGKATGQYKNHFNVEYEEPLEYVNKQASVNFHKVDYLELFDSTEEIFQVEDECFQTAKQTELSSWKQYVYTEVPYTGQKLMSLKWVCSFKNIDNKARLVAKGFEIIYSEEMLKDSPTCSKEALRIIRASIAQKN